MADHDSDGFIRYMVDRGVVADKLTKSEITKRIRLTGLKPSYVVRHDGVFGDMTQICVDDMEVGNAIVRALRDVAMRRNGYR